MSISQWYESFVETTELAVYLEQHSPVHVELTCGSGRLQIRHEQPVTVTVTSNEDKFMGCVAGALQQWISEQEGPAFVPL